MKEAKRIEKQEGKKNEKGRRGKEKSCSFVAAAPTRRLSALVQSTPAFFLFISCLSLFSLSLVSFLAASLFQVSLLIRAPPAGCRWSCMLTWKTPLMVLIGPWEKQNQNLKTRCRWITAERFSALGCVGLQPQIWSARLTRCVIRSCFIKGGGSGGAPLGAAFWNWMWRRWDRRSPLYWGLAKAVTYG